MVEVPASNEPGIPPLDVCKVCEFVWFDPREYEQAPPSPPPPKEPELPQKARELLAIHEVERLAKEAERDSERYPEETWKYLPAVLGMPVEIEESETESFPWVTWGTAAVVVVVSLLAFQNLSAAVNSLGLIPSQGWKYGGLSFLTAFFLHSGLLHLFGNLYFLVTFGDDVEDYLGHWRFVILLLAATLVGGLVHVIGDPRVDVPVIGASGGISGVITFYALQFPRARLGFFLRVVWLSMPAWGWMLLWIVFQFFGAWQQVEGLGRVSALGHLGGAAVGLLGWLWWRRRSAQTSQSTLQLG